MFSPQVYVPLPFFCSHCASPRPEAQCWKCMKATIVPAKGWINSHLPSVERLSELGREVGYVMAIHGSLQRDLDVVAVPWTEDAVSVDVLLKHLCDKLPASQIGALEIKPLGRLAVTLQIKDQYCKPIDLSICPRI